MDVAQQRAVTRIMVLQKKPKEIHDKLVATLGDNALSYAVVKNGQLFSRLVGKALMTTHEVIAQQVQ